MDKTFTYGLKMKITSTNNGLRSIEVMGFTHTKNKEQIFVLMVTKVVKIVKMFTYGNVAKTILINNGKK